MPCVLNINTVTEGFRAHVGAVLLIDTTRMWWIVTPNDDPILNWTPYYRGFREGGADSADSFIRCLEPYYPSSEWFPTLEQAREQALELGLLHGHEDGFGF